MTHIVTRRVPLVKQRNCLHFRSTVVHPRFLVVSCLIFIFCVMFCRSLFFPVSFGHCVFLSVLRNLIIPSCIIKYTIIKNHRDHTSLMTANHTTEDVHFFLILRISEEFTSPISYDVHLMTNHLHRNCWVCITFVRNYYHYPFKTTFLAQLLFWKPRSQFGIEITTAANNNCFSSCISFTCCWNLLVLGEM